MHWLNLIMVSLRVMFKKCFESFKVFWEGGLKAKCIEGRSGARGLKFSLKTKCTHEFPDIHTAWPCELEIHTGRPCEFPEMQWGL